MTDESEPRSVTLTFDGPTYERIKLEASDDGVPVDEWLKAAIRLRISRIDTDLAHSIDADVTIELPDHIRERAELRHEAAQQRGKDHEFADYVWDYINLNPEFAERDGE